MTFTLKEVTFTSYFFNEMKDIPKKKEAKSVGKVSIDLSQYVKSSDSDPILLPLKKKSKSSPAIEITIKSHWLKYNNKVLVKY
jgi:hypothetical protein